MLLILIRFHFIRWAWYQNKWHLPPLFSIFVYRYLFSCPLCTSLRKYLCYTLSLVCLPIYIKFFLFSRIINFFHSPSLPFFSLFFNSSPLLLIFSLSPISLLSLSINLLISTRPNNTFLVKKWKSINTCKQSKRVGLLLHTVVMWHNLWTKKC